MSDASPDIRVAIRRLRDRIFAFIEPLTAVMNADTTLTAHVQPTWDQAMVPFLAEWKQLWEDGSLWTWPSLEYFTRRWNSVSDRVGQILPYALRKQLQQPVVVSGGARERGRGEYGQAQRERARPLIGAQSTSAFTRLSNIVAQHESFWARVAQHSYGHNAAVMKAWLRTAWDPWFTAFGDAVSMGGGMMDDSTATAFARSLTAIRQLAKSPAWLVPVPAVDSWGGDSVLVGAGGSLFGHTPGDVENELDQLHGEIMQFGQEADDWDHDLDRRIDADPDVKPLKAQVDAAFKIADTYTVDPHNPFLHKDLTEAGKKYHALLDKLNALRAQKKSAYSTWYVTTWKPFMNGWLKFHEEKKDVPLQTWPLSGTWDRIQDYRQKLIDSRKAAPFKAAGPAPMDPGDRKDPSFTEGIGDFLKIGKYALIGALAIGGIVALSSVVSNVRNKKDPAENYMRLVGAARRQRQVRAPSAPRTPRKRIARPQAAMLQLPPGRVIEP